MIFSFCIPQSRGFAFVCFSLSDSAEKALLQQFHPIDNIVVEVAPAKKKLRKTPQPPRPRNASIRYDVGPRGRLRPGEFLVIHPFPRPVPMRVKTIKEEDHDAVDASATDRKWTRSF